MYPPKLQGFSQYAAPSSHLGNMGLHENTYLLYNQDASFQQSNFLTNSLMGVTCKWPSS